MLGKSEVMDMAIGPVEMNGMITRTQDFTTIKQNEDNKGMLQQTTMQAHKKQEIDHQMNRVNRGDDAEQEKKNYDAKEKSGGQYAGDGGKHRKKKEEKTEGKVIIKGNRSFDVKI